MSFEPSIERARFNMIEQQIRPWDVLDPGVLELLAVVRREDFVPPAYRAMAFVDTEVPLPCADGTRECMLAPKVEARLLQELSVARHETAYAEAMARQDRAQVVIASARAAEARAQLDLVGQQITRARLVAPFDGVVLAGDLKQQLGAPVRRGDTLLTLAPAEQFRVIIEVEDREISRVRAGQPGEITLSARAHESYPVRVTRITPVSVAREGRNFFEVEATLAQGTPDMRPGLEGVAKLEAQRRSLYWVLGHRAVEWVRMAVWSWSR